MNNITNEYDDQLEGESLVCKPGAEALVGICTLGMPIIGSALLLNGLFYVYLAYIQRCHRMRLARYKATALISCKDIVKETADNNEALSYTEKLLIFLGIQSLGLALGLLVYGFGTMYSTTHIRGQIGDAAAAVALSSWWYVSLLQCRGAKYFKSSIPRPQGIIHVKSSGRFHVREGVKVLDILQSWLAPIIVLMLWALLRAGVYTRAWYAFCMFSLQGTYGLRSFIAIVFQRSAALKIVANMVKNTKVGTREENRQRNGFLIKKSVSLLIDLTTVLCFCVLAPASFILFGSLFNSRKFAIHLVIVTALLVIAQTITAVYSYFKFKASMRKVGASKDNVLPMRGIIRVGANVATSQGSSMKQQSDV